MNPTRYKPGFLLFCIVVVALCGSSASAQSGRRQVKPPPAAPIPTPTPEPTPSPKTNEKESELSFLLGADNSSAFEAYPLAYYDAAMRGCAERLRSGSSGSVDVTRTSLSRGDAIKKAKAGSSYVVLFRLILDNMAQSYDDLEIDFVVFAPVTGKVVISGRSYLNSVRKGPVSVGRTGRGRTGALYREEMIRRAGEDAAQRILKALNLNVPVVK